MRPYVKALQARKLTASAIDLPRSKAERAVPVFIEKVPAGAIAGGHSYGGRVSSMAAIEVPYAALILLSYPLHRPGHPEDLRTEHWPKVACPAHHRAWPRRGAGRLLRPTGRSGGVDASTGADRQQAGGDGPRDAACPAARRRTIPGRHADGRRRYAGARCLAGGVLGILHGR